MDNVRKITLEQLENITKRVINEMVEQFEEQPKWQWEKTYSSDDAIYNDVFGWGLYAVSAFGDVTVDDYEVSEPVTMQEKWTIEVFIGRNGNHRLNVFEEYGRSQQPIYYDHEDTLAWDFPEIVPPQVKRKALQVIKKFK